MVLVEGCVGSPIGPCSVRDSRMIEAQIEAVRRISFSVLVLLGSGSPSHDPKS